MSISNNDFFSEYLNQIQDSYDDQSSLGRLSNWVEKHTYINSKRFSFKGHEFQRGIIDSRHHDTVIIKPSQVGLTEATIRLILAFLLVEKGTTCLHLLPTKGEAQTMTKSRIDPVIDESPYLKLQRHNGSDSTTFKRFGTSQLFIGGTKGKAIISIPVDFLSSDEYDFMDMENMVTAESRLSHSRFVDEELEVHGIRRKWSTPTAIGFGVDGLYTESNQNKRLVKCKHCAAWFWPSFLDHVVVQGWDRAFAELTYHDVLDLDDRGLLPTAKLLCPNCHKPVTKQNLGYEYREWVPEYPSRTRREGFHVSPFDLPSHHSPMSLLRKMIHYKNNTNHFYNFGLGVAYSDASNSILDKVVENNMVVEGVFPEQAEAMRLGGCVAGLDVGKTSWLVIAKPNWVERTLDIIWVEAIRLEGDEDDNLKQIVLERLQQYGVIRLVCDAMPYTPTIMQIRGSRPVGWVLPNFYTLRDTKLPVYVVDAKEEQVNSHRTKSLNYTTKRINGGEIKWPKIPAMKVVRQHLQGMKRVDRELDTGEQESEWGKCGEDHFFHATNYAVMAADMLETVIGSFSPAPLVTSIMIGKDAN